YWVGHRLGHKVAGTLLFLIGGVLLLSLSQPPSAIAAEPTPVHEIAGQGAAAARLPRQGTEVSVEGVVTAVFFGSQDGADREGAQGRERSDGRANAGSRDRGLNGFFIQGRERAPDGKPSGLFVYAPQLSEAQRARLEPGRLVTLQGQVGRFRGRPQLEWIEALEVGAEHPIDTYTLQWPAAQPERYEGVHVQVEPAHGSHFVVSGTYQLATHGTLKLTPQRRAFRPTNFWPQSGPADPALADARLLLDDGSYAWGPDPIPYLDEEGTRRVGSGVEPLTGVLTYAFEQWRLHPTASPQFTPRNPRPEALPEPASEAVRIAAFNVENYFLTLGQRGADSAAALSRQRAKLLAAAEMLKADLLVLVEMENDPAAPEDFIAHLARATEQPWRLVRGGESGSDAIKVAMAYRSDRLELLAEPVRDARPVHHRPPLLAWFRPRDGGPPFGVAGIHFKAKVGCPERGDIDRGQGCWNLRRTEQAEALAEFIAQWRERGAVAGPVLITGDLNAYGAEDPVRALRAAGKIDLVAAHVAWPQRYTYVFRGESGYLDHALAPQRLAEQVCAVHLLPINADEPRFLEFDDGGPQGRHLNQNAFRSSDHDPLAVDLCLSAER
ncbi:hypothetical protein CKO15_07395, partial [Halorhodospira abdelmalekii]|uniref:ExeM/NucH family extracellular endonuclease n=1 Tax=Halorhodospira abdelmalekii TaxID=421629 RepID=UPI0030845063|nr:hypothetical protein [Halorhodospira abdelmalekii]